MNKLFTLFILGAAYFTASSQCCPYMHGFTVQPNPATNVHSVQVITDITTPNSSIRRNRQWIVDQQQKTIFINYCFEGGMLAVLTNYKDTISLGKISPGTYSIQIIAMLGDSLCQNNMDTNTMSGTVVVHNTTGIRNIIAGPASVRYNQATESLDFYNIKPGSSMVLYDITGKIILSREVPESPAVSLAGLPAGCYIVETSGTDGMSRSRFIKNE